MPEKLWGGEIARPNGPVAVVELLEVRSNTFHYRLEVLGERCKLSGPVLRRCDISVCAVH